MKVVVVGAGVAGMATAFEIGAGAAPASTCRSSKRRVAPAATCAPSRSTATCASGDRTGSSTARPETLALVDALGLQGRVVVSADAARRRFLYRHGRLHALPESPLAFLTSRLLSPAGRMRVLGEPFARRRPEGDETIHAFAARRIGREAADVLIDAMVSGVFGGNARELSLRACFPRMWEMETEHGGLVRAMIAKRRDEEARNAFGRRRCAGRPPHVVPGRRAGPRRCPGLGARRPRDDRARRSPRSIAAADATMAGQRRRPARLEADAVVLAAGAATTAPLVEPLAAEAARALREIPSAPMLVLALGYERATLGHPLDGFGFLVPRGEGLRILGALWDSSVYPGRAPEGRGLLRVMLGGAHDPAAVDLDDDRAVSLARAELQTSMGITASPVFTRVFRHPVGIPQYTVGHLDRLSRVERALAHHPGCSSPATAIAASRSTRAWPTQARWRPGSSRRPAGPSLRGPLGGRGPFSSQTPPPPITGAAARTERQAFLSLTVARRAEDPCLDDSASRGPRAR